MLAPSATRRAAATYLSAAALLWLSLVSTGCYGPRRYRSALNSMRAEMLTVEDRYYELQNEFERQQDELERLRSRLGEDGFPEGSFDAPPFPDDLPYDEGTKAEDFPRAAEIDDETGSSNNSRFASQRNRSLETSKPRSGKRRGSSGSVLAPQISLPETSLTADEFMELLEGGADDAPAPTAEASDATDEKPERLGESDSAARFSPIRSSRAQESNDSNAAPPRELDVLVTEASGTLELPSESTAVASVDSTAVAHLVIQPILTGGHDLDGADGDDALKLVIEPRNAEDLFIPATGHLQISLIDPAEEGEAQRVGMWEFSPREVADRISDRPGVGRGITLILPWPDQPPRHRQLKVFVRLITADDRQLETSAHVNIGLEGDGTTGWSARLTPRQVPASNLPSSRNESSRGRASVAERDPFGDRSSTRSPTAAADESSSRLGRPRWRPYR